MKNLFKTIQKDSVLSWSFWVTLTLFVLMVAIISILYTNLPPYIPLYNQMPWGYARLAHAYELFYMPLGILVLCLLNTFIGLQLTEKIPLLARFLFISMVSLAVFTCVFVARLIFLVL